MADLAVYAGLFAVAFVAATVLPLQSESALAALLLTGHYPVVTLIAVASLGNTLGSSLNWLLGRYLERFRQRRWFPVSETALIRAQQWYQRYGRWSLLLSWAPLIGDPLTVAAGVLREPFAGFVLLVAIAKTVRYAILALVVTGAFS
ncbi:MAG: YqaA family protein [Steroidobacteraceae bacterium]